ncbi:protein phosphatase [Aquicoccus sp. SCR17]|nr:protein phosphatase [Carideicomes alvinocaridis]
MASLVLYALRVGGGILALSQMPGRDGRYAADMEHLYEWQPGLVITLATEAELVGHGAADLGADLQSAGTRWAHLPVADMGVPSAEVTYRWAETSARALGALQGGGRVLVHCLGGCGRSGMAALRLMIEAGEKPDRALVRLRALRPCAVETEEQLYWALDAAGAAQKG